MGAGVLMSLEQYLATDYSPDREFVDGVVTERYVGELPRSVVQRNPAGVAGGIWAVDPRSATKSS